MRSTLFDPTAAEVVADPYPFFAEERRLGGVAWVGGRALPRLSRRPFGRWVVPPGSAMLAPAMVVPGPGEVEPG